MELLLHAYEKHGVKFTNTMLVMTPLVLEFGIKFGDDPELDSKLLVHEDNIVFILERLVCDGEEVILRTPHLTAVTIVVAYRVLHLFAGMHAEAAHYALQYVQPLYDRLPNQVKNMEI
jgi:hypothetical protein